MIQQKKIKSTIEREREREREREVNQYGLIFFR
jgi:hypothetical protein